MKNLVQKIDQAINNKILSKEMLNTFLHLYKTYKIATANYEGELDIESMFEQFIDLIILDLQDPYVFAPYHRKITSPFNYVKFGNDFFKPIIDHENSSVTNHEYLLTMLEQINRGENVILLANHQTECDPQLITYAIEKVTPHLTTNMICIAGDRVISDPLARPFSMGCNLLCIYSKRYVNNPPEKKEEKLHHNQKTLKILKMLLQEGGHLIFVAPSGGRDRKNPNGTISPAEFQSDSIEMFRLLAKTSKKSSHFYPIALKTYDILPPPPNIREEIGETREIFRAPVFLSIGKEILFDKILTPEQILLDKTSQRNIRASYVFNKVLDLYGAL